MRPAEQKKVKNIVQKKRKKIDVARSGNHSGESGKDSAEDGVS